MIRLPSALNLSDLLRFDVALPRIRATGRLGGSESLLRSQSLTGLAQQLRLVRDSLEKLQARESAGASSPSRSRIAAASSPALALAAVERPTRLSSTEEVNAIATSFSPFGPTVSGSTTSLPTLGGVYSGAQGDDTLTFEFRRNAVVGSGKPLNVRVTDGSGTRIDTLRFQEVPAGSPVTLSNGLTLSLGEGSVTRRDTFEVQVFASIGSRVDPTKPFDGSRNEQPGFEPGTSVVAGSFEVNGVEIQVAASDSIDSVLSKINAAGAGVTASFDAASERVILSHDTPGTGTTIVLANDSSNFLTATKLASATAIPGQDQTLANDPIADVPWLSGVSDGSFAVNGVSFSLDTRSDSLEDVVARINASQAGATATLDEDRSVLSIRSQSGRDDLVLDEGSSGLFSALGIAPGTYRAVVRGAPVRSSGFEHLPAVQKNLSDLGSLLNGLLLPRSSSLEEFGVVGDRLRDVITSSFESVFDVPTRSVLRSGFGLDFDFTKERSVVEIDRERFEQASIESYAELHDFLFLENEARQPKGLLVSLLQQVDELQGFVERRLGQLDPLGRLVSLFA